jgi:hypothetical protein
VAAQARDAHATFTVSATVNAVANIESQSAPAELTITTADLQRGFIDVIEPTALVIRSNSPSGFALDVTTVAPLLSSILIHGIGAEIALGPDGGTVVQRWQNPHVTRVLLTFRLVLAPGLTAGSYPWPMRISVRPLEST